MSYFANMNIYKYTLIKQIGSGEFGEVWIAMDNAIQKEVAIKLLDDELPIDERLREAQIGNRLNHPNVVNVEYADVASFSEGESSNVVIIAMPYYAQGSVINQLNAMHFLDLDKSLRCLMDILRGLEYLHENGYYHCDIKPENILIDNSGNYLLSDYGITCYSPTHSSVTPLHNYIPHAAPETLLDYSYDERTDIYEFALTAFRLLNGINKIEEDFWSDRVAFNNTILHGRVVSEQSFSPFIPQRIKRIILKASDPNPNKRYQSALEIRREFEKINLHGLTITAKCKMGAIRPVILDDKNEYYYDIAKHTNAISDFVVFKEHRKSKRRSKITKFCRKVKNSKDCRTAIQKFVSDLI